MSFGRRLLRAGSAFAGVNRMTGLGSVLIVDDEPAIRSVMARWLTSAGVDVHTAAGARDALAAADGNPCDVAVIDVRMPGRDGVWLKDELRRTHPQTAVVFATAHADMLTRPDATADIADLLVKPFVRDRFMLAVDRGRQWHKQALEDLRWHARLSAEVRERTVDICAALRERAAAGAGEAEALEAITEARAPGVVAHSARVSRLALAAAAELGLDAPSVSILALACRMHDIGKAAIPEPLLTKPSAHTAAEASVMRRHADVGAEIVAATRTLQAVAPFVLASHEWFAGGGYPLGLAGEDIPLLSRIIAVADAYDAMTQPREYRPALDPGEAVADLLRCAGTQFDPVVVAAFLAALGRLPRLPAR